MGNTIQKRIKIKLKNPLTFRSNILKRPLSSMLPDFKLLKDKQLYFSKFFFVVFSKVF